MSTRPYFFAFYPADFAGDLLVEAMTTEQVGAYILLLCKAWQAEPPASLPNDDSILARYARMEPVDWQRVKAGVLSPFALHADNRWHQKRLRKEFNTAVNKSRLATAAANARWRPQSSGNADAYAEGMQSLSISESDSSSPNGEGGAGEGGFAELVAAQISAAKMADPGGKYAAWAARTALVLAWRKPDYAARFVEWLSGFRRKKVTDAELHAATDDLADRTGASLFPADVLPAINASIKRQREKSKTETKLAGAGQPDKGPSPEERAKVQEMARKAAAKIGRSV